MLSAAAPDDRFSSWLSAKKTSNRKANGSKGNLARPGLCSRTALHGSGAGLGWLIPLPLCWHGYPERARRNHSSRSASPWNIRWLEKRTDCTINLTWDAKVLEQFDPGILDRARRLRSGKSVQREHVTELAALRTYIRGDVCADARYPGQINAKMASTRHLVRPYTQTPFEASRPLGALQVVAKR